MDLATLQAQDRQYLLHPFTNHAAMHPQGTHVMVAGEGCWVTDATGHRLLDALAGLWCVNVGYGRQEIVDAVTRQMQELPYYCSFFNTTTIPAIQLAERLAQLAPPRLNHSFFNNSGSEANETALKLIYRYWRVQGQPQRRIILSRTYAYHGVTVATTSLTGLPPCTEPFGLPWADFVSVPSPYAYAAQRDPADYGAWCVAETERVILETGPESIAALFVEPVQGAGGVIIPPPGYLTALRELCRRYDILFVADEVITGFGRVGAWFASQLWDLDPDLLTMAKGLTSGYLPLSATLVSDEIAACLETSGVLAHGFTYSGHPVTTAAALANLEILEREDLITSVRDDIGPYFQAALATLGDHPAVTEVRGIGLIAALELVPITPGSTGVMAAALAREEGVIVRGIRDLIALSPPLVINRDEVDWLVERLSRVLHRLG
ncbi:MAG: putrescine--pyruvate aminotransferase [Synechococcales cyanobacterium]